MAFNDTRFEFPRFGYNVILERIEFFNGNQWQPCKINGESINQPVDASDVIGVTDGSDAQPGMVGEYFETVGSLSPTLANNVSSTVLSFDLPAGDWDVTGTLLLGFNSATVSDALCEIRMVDDARQQPLNSVRIPCGVSNAFSTSTVSVLRVSISATTTVNLNLLPFFSAGTPTVSGALTARRVR